LITTISALRHRLRKAAGLSKTHDPDPILRDSTGYALNPALVHVDSNAFQELLARSRAASPEEQGNLLAQAVALYRGDLCGDQEMEWLIDVIPAWRREYLEALAALATYYADVAGDLAQAERTARRLVDEEPTAMSYTHLLMRVRAAQNDESGVRKAYHAHRQALIALEMDDEADEALAGLDEEALRETEEFCERLCREIRDRRTQGESVSKAG
jgi:two-component SAPR family response regulator